MARKRLAFEASARRAILGEKHELETLEGYWFRPRKYSVPGEEEINSAGSGIGDKLPASVVKKLIPIYQGKSLGEITEEAIIGELNDDELAELLKVSMGSRQAETDIAAKILEHGIGEHNLYDQEQASTDVSSELIDALLEYAATVAEMVKVIQGYNRPLARSTPETLPMQQNGSTQKQTSASNVPISATEETQPS